MFIHLLAFLFFLYYPSSFSDTLVSKTGQYCGYANDCDKKTAQQGIIQVQSANSNNFGNTSLACQKNNGNPSEPNNIATGARKTMALIYGSCDVLKLPVRALISKNTIPKSAISHGFQTKRYIVGKAGRSAVYENHPYLNSRYHAPCDDKSECSKSNFKSPRTCKQISCFTLKNPALYQYSVKPSSNSDKNTNSVFVTTGSGASEASGIDCSGYAAEAMTIAGLRVKPFKKLSVDSMGSGDFWDLGNKTSSGEDADCFKRVIGTPGISSGDLIVAGGSHVVIVDTVGRDPFGIEEVLAMPNTKLTDTFNLIKKEKDIDQKLLDRLDLEKILKTNEKDLSEKEKASIPLKIKYLDNLSEIACDQLLLDPTKYRVTITHSSPDGGSVGVQREKAFPGLSSLGSALKIKARMDCVYQLKSKWIEILKKSNPTLASNLTTDTSYTLWMKKKENESNATRIIRHDASRAGCLEDKKPEIEGLSCISCCSAKSTYSEMVPTEPTVSDENNSDDSED